MEFKLQVGDVVKLRYHRGSKTVERFHDGYICFLGRTGKPYSKCLTPKYASELLISVHRPTPDGMVQVWPEVQP